MPVTKLIEFLDANKVKYVTINHSQAFTAQEIAASAHIKGRDLAKTVIVRVDGRLAMAVLPSSHHVDFKQLALAIGARQVTLATEEEFRGVFLDCQVGAMPPFGNLYGLDVYVAESLMADDEIAFNACSHTLLVRMKCADFVKLAKPKVIRFAIKEGAQAAGA